MTSCTEISSELAALRADIAALNGRFALKSDLNQLENKLNNKFITKGEKPQIIQASVAQAEQLILPAIGYAITQRLAPILARINAIDNLLKILGAGLAKLNPLLQLLGNIGILLQLATSAAALLALGSRMDALDRLFASLQQGLSDALSQLGLVKSIAIQAKDTATKALSESGIAIALAREVDGQIKNINGIVANLKQDVSEVKNRVSKLENLFDSLQRYVQQIVLEFFSRFIEALGELGARLEYVAGQASAALTIGKEANSNAKIARYETGELRTSINGLTGRVSSVESLVKEIPSLKDKIKGVEGVIGGINSKIGTIQAKIGSIEGEIENLKARLGNIIGSIPRIIANAVPPIAIPIVNTITPPIVNGLVPPAINRSIPNIINQVVNYITNNVTNIFNMGNEIDLSRLENKIDAIPSAMIAAYIASPAVFTRNVAASATGTCQTMQPGGCSDNAMRRNNGDLFNKISDLFNSGANAAQLALLNVINTKLGQQINNAAGTAIGIGGAILRIGQNTVVDRFLNLLTFAATVHNATQLSSNIAITLIQTMQNVLDFFGLKDGNDQSYNLSQLIGTSIENFLKSVLGASTVESFKTTWAQYSRIYQAGANLFSSLMSMGDSITQGLQVIGGQTGKIGNALRAWGVVSEKAYSWMNPTPNFSNPLLTKLNSLEETASMVENVSQQPLNVKSAKEELEASSKALADSLEQKPDSPQAPPIPEALKVKEEQTEIKTSSAGKDLADSDLEPDE